MPSCRRGGSTYRARAFAQDTCTYLHTLWSGPYQITISLIALFAVVSWATFAGLAVMLLQIPLVSVIARRVKMAQRTLMSIKDPFAASQRWRSGILWAGRRV